MMCSSYSKREKILFSWALFATTVLLISLALLGFSYLKNVVFFSGVKQGELQTTAQLYSAASNRECQPIDVPLQAGQEKISLINIACLRSPTSSGATSVIR